MDMESSCEDLKHSIYGVETMSELQNLGSCVLGITSGMW